MCLTSPFQVWLCCSCTCVSESDHRACSLCLWQLHHQLCLLHCWFLTALWLLNTPFNTTACQVHYVQQGLHHCVSHSKFSPYMTQWAFLHSLSCSCCSCVIVPLCCHFMGLSFAAPLPQQCSCSVLAFHSRYSPLFLLFGCSHTTVSQWLYLITPTILTVLHMSKLTVHEFTLCHIAWWNSHSCIMNYFYSMRQTITPVWA